MGMYSLKKIERLSSQKAIKELFEKGSSFYLRPYKVQYLPNPDQKGKNQILVSVSTRNFKKAVDRNLIKRRIREAYRLQKDLIEGKPNKLIIAFIYTEKSILPFEEIKTKLYLALQQLEKL
jgi:ribonuclease P protein component